MERTKAKPRGTAKAAEDAFNAILSAPPIQERIVEGGLPTTPGQWALLLADSVIADLSPPARQAFDSLCASGCHRLILAVLLAFEPRHMRSALQLLGGPLDKSKRRQAAKLLHRPYIPMLRENNTRTGFFERHEFEAVLERLPEHLRPIVTFAYLTGWRIRSEVLSLQWRNVDRKAGIIRLDPGATKNHDGRVLPYRAIPELNALIEDQWAAKGHLEAKRRKIITVVFHRDGRPIRDFHKVWQRAATAAGYARREDEEVEQRKSRGL